jgi:hypothetical protein
VPTAIPLLHAAPDWKPDRSECLILYHGCTAVAKDGIEKSGIDLGRCAVDTDFGRGFYTTTLERQARLWAWDQYYRWRARNPRGTGNQPVVLRFRVRRYTRNPRRGRRDDGLDRLRALAFVRGDYDAEDYWSLVQWCRQSTPADPAAGTPEVVHDHRRPKAGWYELVSGPVAAFWRQRVAMAGADQYSFHQGGVTLLDALVKAGKGKGPGGQGDPDYYRWDVVT